MTYNSKERIGVHSIAKIFTEKLEWIFREQPISDFGIDAYVEITEIGFNTNRIFPTGKLIGVQIKCGQSFFKEDKVDCFVFRGEKRHLHYWLDHSVPVILIIYNDNTLNAYWREINKSTVVITGKGFRVDILKQNLLTYKSREALANVTFFNNNYLQRLRRLQNSLEEAALLTTRKLFLYIEIDNIPNSDYCYITLLVTDEDNTSFPELLYIRDSGTSTQFEHNFILPKTRSLSEAISDVIPWADLLIDKLNFTDELLATKIADEILSFNQTEFINDIQELKEKNEFFALACYLSDSYCFHLELKANEFTNAFLEVDRFLNKESIVRT